MLGIFVFSTKCRNKHCLVHNMYVESIIIKFCIFGIDQKVQTKSATFLFFGRISSVAYLKFYF